MTESLLLKPSQSTEERKDKALRKCHGEYCKLINVFHEKEALTQNIRVYPKKSNFENQIEWRSRAYKILEKVLTKEELMELEDNGKITEFKIDQRIRSDFFRPIPKSCVDASSDHYRIAFLKLQDAEESGSSIDTSERIPFTSSLVEPEERQIMDEIPCSSEYTVQVCETCYYTYRLLSQYKYLTDSSYRKEMTGTLESRLFQFEDLEKKTDGDSIYRKVLDPNEKSASPLNPKSNYKGAGYEVGLNAYTEGMLHPSPAKTAKDIEPLSIKRKKGTNRGRKMHIFVKNSGMKIYDYKSDSSISYSILESLCDHENKKSGDLFSLIVCHDIFDTYERMAIYWKEVLTCNDGHQLLLWNYPGQAFTKFSEKQILNNEFHADCLKALLDHIGPDGSNEFRTNRPFYLLGHGHGGSIACLFAKSNPSPFLKGLILLNPLSFVDTHIASVLHDCRNVFTCCPEERPDLPIYFYSRFIFSDNYLKKTTAPLALSLYTAVNNPISLKGRIRLCDGILKNVDVRTIASDIRSPIISVHGRDSSFVRPLHAETFSNRRLLCYSIQNLFQQKGKRSIIMTLPGGHELFQEQKKVISTLIQNLITGYYESIRAQPNKHVIHVPTSHQNELITNPSHVINQLDRWEDVLARTVNETKQKLETNVTLVKVQKPKKTGANEGTLENHNSAPNKLKIKEIEKNNSAKEYMSWRLKRNKKRLSRFQHAAKVIQNSLRVFMAKTMLARLKRNTSATTIQRCYRGMLGRQYFIQKRKELWAARFVQRTYRGALGRRSSYFRRICIISQVNIARAWRGFLERKRFREIKVNRNKASTYVQSLWRRQKSIKILSNMKLERNCSIVIQRLYRGHQARKLANNERKRYVFSVSQSRGIKIGRKLLMEYKIRASKLQSELSILAKEKNDLSLRVNDITKDIFRFETRAKELEKSMQDLSIIEVQQKLSPFASARAAADISVREKKIQLDQEFSVVLTKITDRKNQLSSVDGKLSQIELSTREKQEELKSLERKLVVLLESQENELSCIKKKQSEKLDSNVQKEEVILQNEVQPAESNSSMDQHEKTASLIDSTEHMMKFGFSSMAMTYFTSLNMVRAMKSIAKNNNNLINHESIKHFHELNCKTEQRCNDLKLYSLAGGDKKQISTWSVDDVVAWLKILSLHQYEDSFRDGAVDGPFLNQLTEDDLQNALGVDHKLHRKKIMFGIKKLSESVVITSEFQDKALLVQDNHKFIQRDPLKEQNIAEDQMRITPNPVELNVPLRMEDLSRCIRSNKYLLVKEALNSISDTKFDEIDLRIQFMDGIGTVYKKHVSDLVFHINKSDEHGNTLMHVAAQNGNMKIAKLLISKGSNPNHQNKQGQTPGHFAVAYQFYDFASWLFDDEGGGGDDLLVNVYGLGPYDGLTQS